jgi:hypothetical protein
MHNNQDQNLGGFAWGALAQTILPTIGSVIGQLINATKTSDGKVNYTFSAGSPEGYSADDEIFDSSFVREDSIEKDGNGNDKIVTKYFLKTLTYNDDDKVTIAFPTRGSLCSETLTLCGASKVEVTKMFSDNANGDNGTFELTASRGSAMAGASSGSYKVSASARQIVVGDGEKNRLGSFLDVVVNTDKITIIAKDGNQISSIASAYLYSSRDTDMRFFDVSGQTSGTEAIICFAENLRAGDVVDIDVTVNFGSAQKMQELQAEYAKRYNIQKMTPEEIAELKAAPRLNRRDEQK